MITSIKLSYRLYGEKGRVKMANWQIEQFALGIVVLALFIHLAAWSRLCDRVTRLETLVKLLEKEIIAIHKNEDGE